MPRAFAPHPTLAGLLLGSALSVVRAAPSPLHAQAPDPVFERLDETRLSHNSVYAITEDAWGFLWIGTADGLNRYDGYEFRVYRHDPRDSGSLPTNVIYDLHASPDGALWVATGNGLGRFDPLADRFTRYPLPGSPGDGALPVHDLFEDRSGTLWAGTTAGVFHLEGERDRFVPFAPLVRGPDAAGRAGERPRLAMVRQDSRGRLWFLGDEGGAWALWCRHESGELERFDLAGGGRPVFDFLIDRGDRLWLGPSGPEHLDRTSRRTSPSDGPGETLSAWAFHEAEDGVVWIGAEDGLYRFDPGSGRITHHRPDPERTAYLFNHVRALYEDRSGTLWVGTHGGLYRADPHAKPFRHLAGDPHRPSGLSSRSISSVYADSGSLWLGTYGAGLNRVDRSDGTVRRYRHDPADPSSLRSDIVWALHRGESGTLWIGTGDGLSSFDPRSGRFRAHDLPPPADERAAGYIRDIAEDPTGTLWLTAGHGLYRFDPESGAARLHTFPRSESGAGPRSVESVLAPEPETIWVGMGSGDLYRLDGARDAFQHYPLLAEDGERLHSEGVWDLHLGPDGVLWLATGSGLSRFDRTTGTFRHYFPRDGLPGSVVYSIVEEGAGRLWLGTNAGLSRFDPGAPAGRQFRTFDASDGIGNSEFNRRAAFAASNGELFFGGLEGLTSFFPDALEDNSYVPPVVFTRIESADRARVTSHNPRGLERLVLSHRDYALSFEVAALSFTNPARNRYAYRLAGFDEKWIDAGTRRFIRYTNVPPGDYVLRVRGSNNDGRWNERGVALRLSITPPYWATWWFRVAMVLALVAALVAAYRLRVGRLLEIERLRLRIAGDLHDDLSSNLSAIALMSEMIRRGTPLGSRERAQLSRIGEAARGMVESVRDIVWLVDPAHDQLDDLLLKMKDVATSLLDGVELDFRSDARQLSASLGLGFRRQLFLIYKEILHNIARHARATSVSIQVVETGGRLTLRVSDDGVGFDPAGAGGGFGLRSLRERARELGGSIEITSRPGRGTRIELEAPIA